ncbi:hypothetical protein BJF79_37340 [Actinomadura sp. CNU-125]|nr:hypothetical protein BJF79_37340 [Actinomadura sp. CNU-125]
MIVPSRTSGRARRSAASRRRPAPRRRQAAEASRTSPPRMMRIAATDRPDEPSANVRTCR